MFLYVTEYIVLSPKWCLFKFVAIWKDEVHFARFDIYVFFCPLIGLLLFIKPMLDPSSVMTYF